MRTHKERKYDFVFRSLDDDLHSVGISLKEAREGQDHFSL